MPASFAPMPVFKLLAEYIAAALTGRDGLYHLVVAIFTSAHSAVKTLTHFYQTHRHGLTLDKAARLNYCAARLQAIFYTLRHAPERFLAPSQLRALVRARAVLAHIWAQPVDFSPLYSLLTAPAASPRPPLGARTPSSALALGPRASSPAPASSNPQSAIPNPQSSSPHLLTNPGRALAAVLNQLGAIYGVRPAPALASASLIQSPQLNPPPPAPSTESTESTMSTPSTMFTPPTISSSSPTQSSPPP